MILKYGEIYLYLIIKKLSEEEKKEIEKIKIGSGSLPQSELLPHRLPELPAELVPIIEKIWQENIPGDK